MEIQAFVDAYNVRLFVVGGAARGTMREKGSDLPYQGVLSDQKRGTKSDIDYKVIGEEFPLQDQARAALPELSTEHTVLNEEFVYLTDEPAIMFEPHQEPVYFSDGQGAIVEVDNQLVHDPDWTQSDDSEASNEVQLEPPPSMVLDPNVVDQNSTGQISVLSTPDSTPRVSKSFVYQIKDPIDHALYRVELESGALKGLLAQAEQIIDTKLSTELSSIEDRKEADVRKLLYQTIIDDVLPIFRSNETKADWGSARNVIRTGSGLGQSGEMFPTILAGQVAVCQELCLFTHILLARYGVQSSYRDLWVPGGYHAVIEVEGLVLDPSYSIGVHTIQDYYSTTGAVDDQFSSIQVFFRPGDAR